MVRGKGWEHIFSVGKVTERRTKLSIILELYQPHLFVHRRPLYAPCIFETKKTRGAHGVDKHFAEKVGEWWLGVDTRVFENIKRIKMGVGLRIGLCT